MEISDSRRRSMRSERRRSRLSAEAEGGEGEPGGDEEDLSEPDSYDDESGSETDDEERSKARQALVETLGAALAASNREREVLNNQLTEERERCETLIQTLADLQDTIKKLVSLEPSGQAPVPAATNRTFEAVVGGTKEYKLVLESVTELRAFRGSVKAKRGSSEVPNPEQSGYIGDPQGRRRSRVNSVMPGTLPPRRSSTSSVRRSSTASNKLGGSSLGATMGWMAGGDVDVVGASDGIARS